MRSFQAPTDCFRCRHFSSPVGIEHSIVDVITFWCFKSRCAQKNSAAGCIREAAGLRSQVSRDNNGGLRIAAHPCGPHWKISGFTWFDNEFVRRPLRKHWKSTRLSRQSTWDGKKLAMKEQRPGAWHGGLWLQASKWWNKMEWSGVPVVFETCETLVLLDRCRAYACFQKSHWNGMETRWKDMKSGMGEGVLRVVKLEKNSNTSIKQYLVLAKIRLDFDSWSWLQFLVVDMALC